MLVSFVCRAFTMIYYTFSIFDPRPFFKDDIFNYLTLEDDERFDRRV